MALFLRRWITRFGSSLVVLLAVTVSGGFAEIIPVGTFYVLPATGINRLSVTISLDVGSDTESTTVSGSQDIVLQADFNPLTHAASVTGIQFIGQTPGNASLTDMQFSYLFGIVTITADDIKATLDTPSPFGPVSQGSFNTLDHNLILNSGWIRPSIADDIDLSTNPINTTTAATGTVTVSPPVINGNLASYTVTINIPVSFSERVSDDPQADVAADGSLKLEGMFTRILPPPEMTNRGGATDVTMQSAVLNGELDYDAGLPTEVSVFWGPHDGGPVIEEWEHTQALGPRSVGPVTHPLTGLEPDTTVYYRYYATNQAGESWAEPSTLFTTTPDFDAFDYRMEITFSGYSGGEVLNNFPALIQFNETEGCLQYDQFASLEGSDLRFGVSNQSKALSYEVEQWDADGDSFIWVQVPELVDDLTRIWAYWGYSNAVPSAALPDELPGLQLWLKADEGVQASGSGAVTNWLDQSGHQRHAVRKGTADSITTVQIPGSGLPVVRFTYLTDSDYLETGYQPEDTDNLTVISASRPLSENWPADGSSIKPVVVSGNPAFGDGKFAVMGNRDQVGRLGFSGHGTEIINAFTETEYDNGSLQIAVLTVAGTNLNEMALTGLYNSVPTLRALSTNPDPDNGPVQVGGSNTSGSRRFHGDIAEVLIYDRILTRNEQNQVGFYLERKYGLATAFTDPLRPVYASNGSTWDDAYELVWHFAGSTGAVVDASAQGRNAAALNEVNRHFIGPIAGALDLPGSNAFVQSIDTEVIGALDRVSMHGWFKHTATGGMMFSAEGAYAMYSMPGGALRPFFDGSSSGNPAFGTNSNDNAWHHVVAQNDGVETVLYVDGVLAGSTPESLADLAQNGLNRQTAVGANWDGNLNFQGAIDEFRVADSFRSSHWILAAYLNQASNTFFNRFGPVITTLFIDCDRDLMDDHWEVLHFGNTALSAGGPGEDQDTDGFIDIHEYLAGTDPTNSASFLGFFEIPSATGTGILIQWPSVSNQTYTLYGTTNLNATWTAIAGPIPATPPVNRYTAGVDKASANFYYVDTSTE